ncbi:ChuX/HutX family heme-like substrate-binding protein [Amylibacter sp. IMCC11727]|uniref:hemin-degrading factor n=1 Tax=Amylibacter sp. IMCC11727 TaxID=3039851 RepID=UPI00244DB4C2|nr:ChuX/HutX family heme-like substrate-binding protein [Amylibacter sp. IMCC11727]WGI21499.1 ChuX/HutX family heme-like substrate-binding protein [Amylibacter sp. IMCC11727]
MLDHAVTDTFERYQALTKEKGSLRAVEAARELGVSEAELVEAKQLSGVAKRLRRDETRGFAELLEGLVGLGEVMCLTRNEHAVHERYGEFDNVKIGRIMGLVLNRTIDLRIFMQRWVTGFVIEEEVASGLRVSLQFFDKFGVAVHKIYPTEQTDRAGFDTLVADWIDLDPAKVDPKSPPTPELDRPDSEIDVVQMRADWEQMTDVHQFIGLLNTHKVGRMQAFRLIGEDMCYEVPTEGITWALEKAAETQVPIMVFIGNKGCIQIHTGEVKNIKAMGPWINVLDEKFHMHLRQDKVAHAWVVRKPSKDGIVTSLEAFDAEANNFCMMFGERGEGNAELDPWREILNGLGTLS